MRVGQDWDLTDGCSIVEQGLRIVSDGTIQDAIQSNVVTNGKTYKVQYEIIEAVSGSLKITGTFGANLAINSTVGVHTFYARLRLTLILILEETQALLTLLLQTSRLKRWGKIGIYKLGGKLAIVLQMQ